MSGPVLATTLWSALVGIGIMFIPWPWSPSTPLERATALLWAVCSQRATHSYFLGPFQLPLEARMMGLAGGITAGSLVLGTVARGRSQRWPSRVSLAFLLVSVAAMAFDGANAFLFDFGRAHLYAPDLRLRLATGTLAGLAVPFLAVPLVCVRYRRPAHPDWRDIGVAAALAGLFGLLTASGHEDMLYATSLIAVAGVVLGFALIARIVLGHWFRIHGPEVHNEWWLGLAASGVAMADIWLLGQLNTWLEVALA